jgi:UDP-N-acetyl-D-galactosamine dehydrogenase
MASKTYEEMIPRLENSTVGIVGLGYVGLHLALRFDEEGHTVHGYDTDEEKIHSLRTGTDPTQETNPAKLESSTVQYTTDPGQLRDCDYVLIAVPTPITDAQEPHLDFIRAAGRTVGANIRAGTTVVLESTVYPGATNEVLVPTLEAETGLTADENFFVGYSPERIVPGNGGRDFRTIAKIVSARDEATAQRLEALYGRILDADVHRTPNIETAEAAKCLENIQRDLNIGLVNEFAIACNEVDIDITANAVLEAASTKWNFHRYRPGFVGGHCLPVDPHLLIYQFERYGYSPELPSTARRINERIPRYVANLLLTALERRRADEAPRADSERVLIAGVSYKPGSSDIRSSPVDAFINELRERNVELIGYEPYVEENVLSDAFEIPFQKSLSVRDFDALVVPTPHEELRNIDLARIGTEMNHDPVLVDVTHTYDGQQARKHGFEYVSI